MWDEGCVRFPSRGLRAEIKGNVATHSHREGIDVIVFLVPIRSLVRLARGRDTGCGVQTAPARGRGLVPPRAPRVFALEEPPPRPPHSGGVPSNTAPAWVRSTEGNQHTVSSCTAA